MSSFYGEYTTLNDLVASGEGAQLNISGTAANTHLSRLIRETSRDIDAVCNRIFVPRVQAQTYDAYTVNAWSLSPWYRGGRAGDVFQSRTGGHAYGRILYVDDDLLEVTTLTNGDGSSIAAANYLLYPANSYPKESLHLKQSAGIAWLPDSSGNYEQVISLTGIFGYHDNYTLAWYSAGTIADVAGINSSVTSYTASASHGIVAGMLLKIESEYVYVSGVSTNTITIVRGVNGSTAAAHATATAVNYWGVMNRVSEICREAVAARWNLRANPIGQTITIGNVQFNTPNSISEWLQQELYNNGLVRSGLG